MWVCYFPGPPPQEVGAPRSARQSRLIADIYLVGGRREAVYCSDSCVPGRIFSRQRRTATRERRIVDEACSAVLSSGGNNSFESKSKSQSPRSSRAGLNQRRKVTVVYVRREGRSGSYGLGALRGLASAPRTLTRPARCVIRPDCCCCCQLGRRVAAGGKTRISGRRRGRWLARDLLK